VKEKLSVNIGIIGAGHMGYLHFLSCLKMKKPFQVICVADKSKNTRKKIEEFNIKTYVDYNSMLEKEELDCLIISLPNFLKKECIEISSNYCSKIFVDKPIARNYQETKDIFNITNKKGVQIMVGTNYRYHPHIQKIKEKLDMGIVGDIKLASYELIMNGPLSHPRTPRPIADWYVDPEKSGGGAVIDLGYHLLDLNQWFFGPSKVKFASIDHIMNLPVDDSSTIITESEDGNLRSVFNVGWFSKVIFPEFNFRVNLHGSNGYLSSEKFTPNNLYLHAVKIAITNFIKKITLREIDYLSFTFYYSSFYKIIEEFLTSVQNDMEFPIDFEDQLEVMKIIDSIYERGKNE
jgi:predicted dehydrogenase